MVVTKRCGNAEFPSVLVDIPLGDSLGLAVASLTQSELLILGIPPAQLYVGGGSPKACTTKQIQQTWNISP